MKTNEMNATSLMNTLVFFTSVVLTIFFSYELEDKASQIKKAKQKGSTRVKRKTDIWALGQNKDRTKKITK
jgi:hypothetical protein